MPKKAKAAAGQLGLLDARVSTAPCVPAIRQAVADWKAKGYPNTTETSKRLLSYWFKTDHRLPDGHRFRYHYFQQEAVETLVYLYEAAKVRSHKALLEGYAPAIAGIRLLHYDDFARYAVKMATGSGKTKVMSLAVAWQYLNATAEGLADYAKTFLILAPNVIVFERLRSDFAGGRVFRTDPVIPPDLAIYWDVESYVRGEPERASSEGAIYLTNIQQLYSDKGAGDNSDEPEEMSLVLGNKPVLSDEGDHFRERIAARASACLVINDEGHHTHDEDNEWNAVIRGIHDGPGDVQAQIDLSATPRYPDGGLFTWTVYDYPLKQAIIDNVVKRPMKGVTAGIKEQPSDVASVRYRVHLTAGVERWREYRTQLQPLQKRPILFVMMNSTDDAEDVADYLRTKYPEDFAGTKLLVIHTDRKGDISKKDLDAARDVARRVDDETSSVNAIVSVLMLREGWDVQNVTVVVGLRPYTAKANILPEQTIGRGLRLMFRDLSGTYLERLDVIGNEPFLKFVEQLEKEEGIALETFDLDEKLVIETIFVDQDKIAHDISIPTLSPILARKKTLAEEIASLDVAAFAAPVLPVKAGDAASLSFHYEGYDIITLEKIVERDYAIPEPQSPEEVISYYAKRIAQDLKLPSQFAALVPKVREFLETRAFGHPVVLQDRAIIKAISTSVAQYVTVRVFSQALKGLLVEELSPELHGAGRSLSETPPFPHSRPTAVASKTIFNLAACDNEFEREFAEFLEAAPDVKSFAKLPERFGFTVEYTDSLANLRYYEPDFVAVTTEEAHVIIETKGREDVDVAFKDRAATIWCENATLLTATAWSYVKVPQTEFNKLHADELSDVLVAFQH
jgi:type III restriction enzyme